MKVRTGLVTALVVSTGLVAPPAAQAAPYPHTITTYCHADAVKNPISRSTRPKFRFSITTNGNGRPKTTVRISIIRKRDGVVVSRTRRSYNEPVETWSFRRLHRGRYKFVFRTATGHQSVYKNCRDAAGLRVTR
jgi:hypothetical protein